MTVDEPTAVDPKILQALRSGDADALSRVLVNDLQRASIELAPSLRDTLGLGESCGAIAGIVSGSGPTVALLAHNPEAAEGLAEELRHKGLTALPSTARCPARASSPIPPLIPFQLSDSPFAEEIRRRKQFPVAHLLGGENLTVSYATRTVLDGVTLGLEEGDRIGMVGRNGDGKSTLMRLLALRSTPDSGRVTKRGDVNIGYLDQSDVLDGDLTVGAAIVGDQADYEWARNPQIREVMGGLVSDVDWHANVHALSGGQKRRVALAKLLIEDHDVIMLDEPTNHLDVEGVAWLSRHLKTRWRANQGAFLVVTHDRWFLDEVCNKTWEIHDGIMDPFDGGYAAYVLARAERDRAASVMEGKRQQLVKKELAWLRRGAPARTAKPKFRIEAANALIADVPEPRDSMALSKMATARLGKDVLDLENVSLDFLGGDAGQKLFDNITLRLAPGERLGLVGVNGAGKTTLLKLLNGEIQPTSGKVKRGKTVVTAVLTQEVKELDDVCRPARHRGYRARKAFLQRWRQGIHCRPARGTAWLHQREAVDPRPRPFRR